MNKIEMRFKTLCLSAMGKVLSKWEKDLNREIRKNQPIIPANIQEKNGYWFGQKELDARINQLQEVNSRKIVMKYCEQEIKKILAKDNYLTTVQAVMPIAVARFIEEKNNGTIDFFNNYVEESQNESVKGE